VNKQINCNRRDRNACNIKPSAKVSCRRPRNVSKYHSKADLMGVGWALGLVGVDGAGPSCSLVVRICVSSVQLSGSGTVLVAARYTQV
jgi:hypothetical protein